MVKDIQDTIDPTIMMTGKPEEDDTLSNKQRNSRS
jgi:hypothetical protein